MRKAIFIFLVIVLALHAVAAFAQKIPAKELTGVYMLQGVMETAAGLELKPDGTFEYGFVYGAADKWGKGTWKKAGTKLKLTSHHQQPKQDFELRNSDNNYSQGIRIKIVYDQKTPLAYVKCRLGNETADSDANGEVYFKNINDGLLEMYHPIYGQRLTRIQLNKSHTSFIINAATDLSEVYFTNFELEVLPGELVAAALPGMPPEDAAGKQKRYVFKRQK